MNDPTRQFYRELTDLEKAYMKEIKIAGAVFIGQCQDIGTSRELSLAITKAEEAVMWAVKHITGYKDGKET